MLFLHGFPQFWFLWRHQLADLGQDHRAIAADMRGYNPVSYTHLTLPTILRV